jgi:hypothetical protein
LTHTFDIRFARTAGLAVWLEEPANRFRWKGTGRLSISRDGITIVAKRGLSSLFRSSPPRRIPAADLKEVYREGAALRFEFATPENPREVVPLWADSRDVAASIVQLLPTTRTVELDGEPARAAPRPRMDRRVVAALLAGVVIGAIASAMWMRAAPEAVPTVDNPRTTTAAPAAIEVDDAAPSMPAILPDARPAPRDGAAYKAASRAVSAFNAEANELLRAYQINRMELETDVMSREQFAESLPALERQWWKLTVRILDADELAVPQFADVRASMLDMAADWRKFLSLYAEGMRKDDPALIRVAFATLARAERAQWQVWRFER